MDRVSKDPFAEMYSQHAPFVRMIAVRHLRDPGEAEDLVQDVFLQAWTRHAQFDPSRGNIRVWLGMITRSRAVDRLRRRSLRHRIEGNQLNEEVLVAESTDPLSEAERRRAFGRLRGVLPALPPLTREIIDLAYSEELTQRQIAARTRQTLGVVKSRLRQGLLRLREQIPQRGDLPTSVMDPQDASPLTVRILEPPSQTAAVPPLPSLAGMQVLVVDDDLGTREMLQALMARAGGTPRVCSSTAEASGALEKFWPDVLLADICMPGQDGYELIRLVRGLERQTGLRLPAVAFTGRASEFDRSFALRAGYHAHLSKPVHPSALLAAILRVTQGAAPPSQ